MHPLLTHGVTEPHARQVLRAEIDERLYRLHLPAPRLRQAGGLTADEIKLVEEGAN